MSIRLDNGALRAIALAAALIAGSPLASAANIKVLTVDNGVGWTHIGALGLPNVTVTEVSSAAFATTDLGAYDVLFIGETFRDGSVSVPAQDTLDALAARKADIGAWVSAGHGVVALPEPIGNSRFAWLPDALMPTFGTVYTDSVRVVDPSHPVMAGLTSASLSNWGTAAHGVFTSPGGFSVLADDGFGNPITLATQYGQGRIVVTAQDALFHFYYNGSKTAQFTLVQNAVNWVAPVPLPASVLLFGPAFAGLVTSKRKRAT